MPIEIAPWMQIPDMCYSTDENLNSVVDIVLDAVEKLPHNVEELKELMDIVIEDRKNDVPYELQCQHVLDAFNLQQQKYHLELDVEPQNDADGQLDVEPDQDQLYGVPQDDPAQLTFSTYDDSDQSSLPTYDYDDQLDISTQDDHEVSMNSSPPESFLTAPNTDNEDDLDAPLQNETLASLRAAYGPPPAFDSLSTTSFGSGADTSNGRCRTPSTVDVADLAARLNKLSVSSDDCTTPRITEKAAFQSSFASSGYVQSFSSSTTEVSRTRPPTAANNRVVPATSNGTGTTEVNQTRPPEAVKNTSTRIPRFTGIAVRQTLPSAAVNNSFVPVTFTSNRATEGTQPNPFAAPNNASYRTPRFTSIEVNPPAAANDSFVPATFHSNRATEPDEIFSPPEDENDSFVPATSNPTTEVNPTLPPAAPNASTRRPRFTGEAARIKLAAGAAPAKKSTL